MGACDAAAFGVEMTVEDNPTGIDELLDTPDLAVALESDLFKQFLDKLPVAIAVSELHPVEQVVYANGEFERLSGQVHARTLRGKWERLLGEAVSPRGPRSLGQAIVEGRDYLGSFHMPNRDHDGATVDAWSNVIQDDEGKPAFRLVALAEAASRDASVLDELEERVREKDMQLQELQHRVRNNLQMVTALIRMEARGVSDLSTGQGFDRLAGRVEALGLLYRALESSSVGTIDLGIYLSEIASAVMRAHAVEGTHLDLQVDSSLVSVDVAMPVGLVVNELLTNALKHAFRGRHAGTITLHSATEPTGCRVIIADDGVGLPEGYSWPRPGKLSALIVRSLLQNGGTSIDVRSMPGRGMEVTIVLRSEEAGAKP
jgi:two-component sensor histidine kinase